MNCQKMDLIESIYAAHKYTSALLWGRENIIPRKHHVSLHGVCLLQQ